MGNGKSLMPKVTVLMSNHNGGAFLAPTVRSILNQTYRDFEFLILDDGSTDDSRDQLRRFAAEDPRVRLVEQDNVGLTPTLNRGLHLATGELVARMDSDDLAAPDRLAKQVAFMDAHPDVVLLGGAYDLIDEAGRRLHVMRPPTDDAALQEHCLSGRTPICHPLAMFRREAALGVGGYDESYKVAQDLDLWLRLGEMGKLACLPDVLLGYRMHAGSVSERKQQLQIDTMRRACESAYARRGVTREFQGGGGWRAQDAVSSKLAQTLQYGWWAWHLGEARTAMVYGWRAIKTKPAAADGWKLLACGALRRPVAASS